MNCGVYELGHLVMHSRHQDEDVEAQANALAAEFLMPEHVIRPQLRALTLGAVSAQERQDFYKRLSRRGWRKQEPGSDTLPPETPRLAASVGKALADAGLTDAEIRELVGVAPGRPSPFIPEARGLHLVA
ncbi:ImmA/IrrE family metallo-endopeptidase [Actinomyces ruminicola]|nr:ImmA/IrrE family metallo-endopeptidase [Actinomyces ruminicola]